MKYGIALMGLALAQFSLVSAQEVKEDFKSMSTNQYGEEYPMVNSQGIVRGRILATPSNTQ